MTVENSQSEEVKTSKAKTDSTTDVSWHERLRQHCTSNEKSYSVITSSIGALMSFITLVLAIWGLKTISDFGEQKKTLEIIEFFAPKVKFEGGQVEYNQNNNSILIHNKLQNIGSLPIQAKIKQLKIIFLNPNKNEILPTINDKLNHETEYLEKYKIDISSKSTSEWPIVFKYRISDSKLEQPFYVCAYVTMNLETSLTDDHKNMLKKLGLDYNYSNLQETMQEEIILNLQSHGKYGDQNYDNLFCQKNSDKIKTN